MPNRRREECRAARRVRSEGPDRNAARRSGARCLGCDRRMREGAPALRLDYGRSFSFGRGRCAAPYSDGHHGLVIEGFDSGGVFGYSLEEGIHDTVRRTARTLGNDLLHSTSAEQLSTPVAGIQDAVAEEHEHISRLHAELELVIVCLVK